MKKNRGVRINYQKLQDILGVEKLQQVAGLAVIIPQKPHEDHALSGYIGVEAAQKLSEIAAGKIVYFPKYPNGKHAFVAERNQKILADRLAGLSYQELAKKYALSTHYLMKVVLAHYRQGRESGQPYPRFLPLKRRIRNEKLLKDYQAGASYESLSKKYYLSEKWVKELVFDLRRQNGGSIRE